MTQSTTSRPTTAKRNHTARGETQGAVAQKKGVNPKTTSKKPAEKKPSLFEKLGLIKDLDFILHMPSGYEDLSRITPVQALKPGNKALVEGLLQSVDTRSGVRHMMRGRLVDSTGVLQLVWFQFYPSQLKAFQALQGQRVRLYGQVSDNTQYGLQMMHPVTQKMEALSPYLTPVYPTTKGLTQDKLRKAIGEVIERSSTLSDTLPDPLRITHRLWGFDEAIRYLHHPPQDAVIETLLDKSHPAWTRIKLDELIAQQLALGYARRERAHNQAFTLEYKSSKNDLATCLLKQLSFALTEGQKAACEDIFQDLCREKPMHRLLQGDVGCGKTIVAAWAAAKVIEQGYQVAIMAPTEVLAEQHFQKMQEWFEPLGVKVGCLIGSTKAAARKSIYADLQRGVLRLVVGTQAIIQDGVNFKHLALVIMDEQHRFGVGQRLQLLAKGHSSENTQMVPHQLNMSATPIPRSLAMSHLADIDITTITELPPGRTPVATRLVHITRRHDVYQYLRNEIAKGHQVYWVCPLVEESDKMQLRAAEEAFATMQEDLPDLRIGLMHGRFNAKEKQAVMDQMRAGEIDILVATTVIEVGVDIPNASVMVIEHAERFGLAQLHQLRGRVGRGSAQSICILMYDPLTLSNNTKARLKAMRETNDGFEIAQRDLEIRGPGELLGQRQSGEQMLRFSNITLDTRLIQTAKTIAEQLQQQYPEAAHAHVARWIGESSQFLMS